MGISYTKNDPFPGVDYASYQQWQKITDPNGNVYYIVPGYPGYALDPIASNASGKKIFRQVSKIKAVNTDAEKQAKAEAQQEKLVNAQIEAASPMGQLLPVAGTVGGMVIANKLMNGIGSAQAGSAAQAAAPHVVGQSGNAIIMSDGSARIIENGGMKIIGAPGQAANVGTQGASVAEGTQAAQGVSEAVQGSAIGIPNDYAAIGTQQSQVAAQAGSPITNAAATDGTGNTLGSFLPNFGNLSGVSSVAIPAAMAANAYMMADTLPDLLKGKGAGTESDLAWGINPVTAPFYWPARALGLFSHVTTKEQQSKNTKGLAGLAPDNQEWQKLLAARQEGINKGPADPSKPFAGKYATFADYKKGGLEANDLAGTYAVLNTIGPDITKADPSKVIEFTQKLIDNNLLDSKKGDVVVTDQAKADEIKKQVFAPTAAASQSQVAAGAAATKQPIAMRSGISFGVR